ncbi:MAG: hypothetical protein QF752_02785 [Planctomycetota bacterium]|jgi:hypothetical protein|nr:hypothetical protein [Planctomycetota bacterium]
MKFLVSFGLTVFLFIQAVSAQTDSTQRRWKLDFKVGKFDSIIIKDPLGYRKVYWYMTYKVTNNTGAPRKMDLDIWLITDVPKGDIKKTELGNIFQHCKLPDNLKTITIDDKINALRISQGLKPEEAHVYKHDQIISLRKAMHRENLRIFSQREAFLNHFRRDFEGVYPEVKEKLEKQLGKKLHSNSDFLIPRNEPKTIRTPNRTYESKTQRMEIADGQSIDGVAIFGNVSREADYIGVMLRGLVQSIVRVDDPDDPDEIRELVYSEKKVKLVCFERLGDEFHRPTSISRYLGERWIVLDKKLVD